MVPVSPNGLESTCMLLLPAAPTFGWGQLGSAFQHQVVADLLFYFIAGPPTKDASIPGEAVLGAQGEKKPS